MNIKKIALLLIALVLFRLAVASEDEIEVPNSQWLESQRILGMQSFRKIDFDLLVLPIQGGENTFDPVGRSLMTRIIADRLVNDANLKIPDPTYVFRVLGSYRSKYPQRDVGRLVKRLAPKKILEMHANHDRSGRFTLVISVLDGSTLAIERTKTWSKLAFSDTKLPSAAVNGIVGEISEFVTNKKPRTVAKTPTFSLDEFRFTESLEELIAESTMSPLHSAVYLQLIGMLHPHADFNENRYGLFERSIVQLNRLPNNYPSKRFLMARAYAYLGRRPAAIAELGKAQTKYERAFLALLNGDLPGLRREVEIMGTSPFDFMAWRELAWLESAYGDELERQTIDNFSKHAPMWAPFIHRALRDSSIRPEFTTATVKLGLEYLLPNDVTTIQLVVDRATITGKYPDEMEFTRLVWRHLDAVDLADVVSRSGKRQSYLGISEFDIVDLAKAVSIANQILRVEHDLSIKRLPEAALGKIAKFEIVLAGHPAVTLQKARALDQLVHESSGAELQALRSQTSLQQMNGLAWTGQMTKDAARAARRFDASSRALRIGKYSEVGKRHRTELQDPVRYFEWPMSHAWFYEMRKEQFTKEMLDHCIDYTWTWFTCVKARVEQLDAGSATISPAAAMVLAAQSHRFIGSSQRERYEIELARRGGDQDSEIRQLGARIDAGSSEWSIYFALGRALKRRGDYSEARDVFLSYPQFATSMPGDAMAQSNYGDHAGSMFYWIGRYEEAIPLLELSASSRTGAESTMSAGNRLALISGDLDAAEAWSAARVRRYGSQYAMRDLQQILHIRGKSDIAWSLFDNAMRSSGRKTAQLWSGALVGHRMASASTGDIRDWINESELRKSSFIRTASDYRNGNVKLAQRYLLLAGTMDRQPGPELARVMSEFRFDRPTRYVRSDRWPRSGPEGAAIVPGFAQEDGKHLGWDELISTPRGLPDKKRHELIEPRYEKMANAMSALLGDDFEGAFEIFNEAARLYYLEEYLPYFAFAASVVGHADHLSVALEAREPVLEDIRRNEKPTESELGYRFDEDLTYAVLASFEGRHEASIRYLQKAMNDRPYLDYRAVYPYFQIVDIADRLFDRTGNALYRDFALDLARRHTTILPMYAWAYFVVAKYSESNTERLDATASGLKLDPLSYRATKLPKSLVDRAALHLREFGAPYLTQNKENPDFDT